MRSVDQTLAAKLKRLLKKKEFKEAARILDLLKIEDPASAQTRGFELEYALVANRREEARRLSAELVKSFPASSRILFLAGQVAYGERDYARAAALFEESTRLHPHWRSRHWAAKAWTQQGELDRALPILLDLVGEHPQCHLDLAWLYERRKEYAKAKAEIEALLVINPKHTLARAEQARLKAQEMDAAELIEEVDALAEFDGAVPVELVPRYVEALLETGHGIRARNFTRDFSAHWDAKTALRVGWIAYRLQAFDISFEMFRLSLRQKAGDFRLLGALEKSARLIGKEQELVETYEALAADHHNLYGRVAKLKERLNSPLP